MVKVETAFRPTRWKATDDHWNRKPGRPASYCYCYC